MASLLLFRGNYRQRMCSVNEKWSKLASDRKGIKVAIVVTAMKASVDGDEL